MRPVTPPEPQHVRPLPDLVVRVVAAHPTLEIPAAAFGPHPLALSARPAVQRDARASVLDEAMGKRPPDAATVDAAQEDDVTWPHRDKCSFRPANGGKSGALGRRDAPQRGDLGRGAVPARGVVAR